MAGIKKFNWVRRPSTWEYAQAWNAQRKSMAQRFLDDGAVASSAFLSAQSSLSAGMATLAAQASLTAAQKQLEATKNQLSSIGNSLDVSA
ncbi:MAG: hypothetical protein GEU95_18070 [Rhizobiales bacterium]|nr:hypothetical protein [Hyphomicrobiales bacterium]